MKKILLVDDSALMRRVLSAIINGTNEYTVAYIAKNGAEGLEMIKTHKDIYAVICDVNMPVMTGIELLTMLKRLNMMLPFVLLSTKDEALYTITALELGAIAFLKKPDNIYKMDESVFSDKLIDILKLSDKKKNSSNAIPGYNEDDGKINENILAKHEAIRKQGNVNVHKHNEKADNEGHYKNGETQDSKTRKSVKTGLKKVDASLYHKASYSSNVLIALVSSTGGPKALRTVIPMLPKNLAAPMIMVQHMPANFTTTLAERLDELGELKVSEVNGGELIKRGNIYLCKGGKHLKVADKNNGHYLELDDSPPVVGLKPCGNIMYDSLVNSSYDEIVCVVLTGMGADGTNGIVNLSKHKKVYVIAQDEASSTVYGMPRAIYEKGMCDVVCDINDIAKEIIKKVGVL
ncbi:MAG: chemotaxis-specific protein-glutamate methyltransferase CheB [Lachnospiraceae bacterium]|nr:chemotaxis-specific protein-glutamate methyltransferase CheB [Lachnospiraceae bacterium]